MGRASCFLEATLMAANFPLLFVAVALLWIPRGWLRRGPAVWRSHSRRNSSNWNAGPRDGESLAFRREGLKPRNYFDLLRAASGTWTLVGGYGIEAALRAAPLAAPATVSRVQLIQAVILLIAVVLQTARWERGRLALTAPVFYLAGVTILLCTPLAGMCGFVIAWVLSPVFPNAQAFLSVQAFVAGLLAILLNGLVPFALLGFGLCVLPIVLSLLTRRPLVVFARRGAASTRDVNA